ncbi:hypothetical protein [Sphingobacterium sp. LRF_L2]|uniref:hypothetical protein n=1 Tax=Sphingobacterium sp. LRF_L2 TaxID=3369421 RepID=UPI003F60AFB7
MQIAVIGADYSGTGLGKVPYVSSEVNALLSVYSEITLSQKSAFQTFVDEIGGIGGTIWNKFAANSLLLPIFSSTLSEALINVCTGSHNLVAASANFAQYWSLSDGKLSQVYSSGSPGDNIRINVTGRLIYTLSPFGIVDKFPDYASVNKLVTHIGQGNLSVIGASRMSIQKSDGTNNQNVSYTVTDERDFLAYTATGLQGISEATQNRIIINGQTSLQAIQASFSQTAVSWIGSLGSTSATIANQIGLRNARVLGFGEGFTLEEASIVNAALINLVSYNI